MKDQGGNRKPRTTSRRKSKVEDDVKGQRRGGNRNTKTLGIKMTKNDRRRT